MVERLENNQLRLFRLVVKSFFQSPNYTHPGKDGGCTREFPDSAQSNRCQILAANGVLDLSIPVVGTKGQVTPINEIRISYDDNWPVKHWRSIRSAYRSAPFFEEYAADIEALIMSKAEKLIDLNASILEKLIELLQIDKEINYHSASGTPEDLLKLNGHFKPSKMPEEHKQMPSYLQVFNYKYDFIPNLSILDLLFNEGPYAQQYLLSIAS